MALSYPNSKVGAVLGAGHGHIRAMTLGDCHDGIRTRLLGRSEKIRAMGTLESMREFIRKGPLHRRSPRFRAELVCYKTAYYYYVILLLLSYLSDNFS